MEPDRIGGVHKFLHRVWTVALDPHGSERRRPDARRDCPPARRSTTRGRELRAAAHRTLRDVTEDYEGFRWNTMVAKLMELTNLLITLPRHVGGGRCPSGTRRCDCCC